MPDYEVQEDYDREDLVNLTIEEIKEIQTASELPLPEFRRIVGTVQQGERSANRAKKEMIESKQLHQTCQISHINSQALDDFMLV